MAFVECNYCGKLNSEVVCEDCYKDLKDQLDEVNQYAISLEEKVSDLEDECTELKQKLNELASLPAVKFELVKDNYLV